MKEYVVEDVSFESTVKDAKESKSKGIYKIDPNAKKRIEILLGLYKEEKHVTFNNVTYTLQTLSLKETKEIFSHMGKLGAITNPVYDSEFQKLTLARGIKEIEGIDFSNYLGVEEYPADVQVSFKEQVINDMDVSVISHLMKEWASFSKEHDEKYTIKNEDTLQEVVEDIKK